MQSPLGKQTSTSHSRTNSLADLGLDSLVRSNSRSFNSPSPRHASPAAGTFAQRFIKAEGLDGSDEKVGGIEGENDFSGKRYVWLKDPKQAFVKGWVVEELDESTLRVQCDDGNVSRYLMCLLAISDAL